MQMTLRLWHTETPWKVNKEKMGRKRWQLIVRRKNVGKGDYPWCQLRFGEVNNKQLKKCNYHRSVIKDNGICDRKIPNWIVVKKGNIQMLNKLSRKNHNLLEEE